MPKPRKRCTPSLAALEPRCLLSGQGPSAVWLGQDGQDLVGGPSATHPSNGVQDIDIALSGLPAGRTIASAQITGYGGDLWVYNNAYWNPWSAMITPASGSPTAHLYIDPDRVETGRTFTITLTFDDGSTASLSCAGGTADPNLRMPADSVKANWQGQDGHDLTGPGPSVGPDGIQDVHLKLTQVTPYMTIDGVTVTSSAGVTWANGLNPALADNAELVTNPSDPTTADLYFSPVGNMNGQTLTVTIQYDDGKVSVDSTTVAAATTNPQLPMPPPPAVPLTWNGVTATWLGQDGLNLRGPGDVHLALSGLPAGRSIVSARLNDPSKTSWYYSATGGGDPLDSNAIPMVVRASSGDRTKADVAFPPMRDESGATLTLSLVLDDGTIVATQLPGGACDPGLTASGPASTSVVAHPGDDLQKLVNQFGTVHLAAGTYALAQPLVLANPVTIDADPGATLVFTQAAGASPWNSAIQIEASHTTLSGFAVQFSGPVQWDWNAFFGPSVIGVVPTSGVSFTNPLVDISLTQLNLLSPTPATSWEAAPNLIRLLFAQNGVVSGNTLKGGSTVFDRGPWQVTDNNYLGTVPGTFAYSAFSILNTQDVVLQGNTVAPTAASGKTWRFLVMVQSGANDVIRDNTVIGVGPMDSDTIPDPNASEVLLTESYQLRYEGTPASISPDGRVLQIPTPPGGSAATGDVVAILTGPYAGEWFPIAQPLSATAYLLAAPLPAGNYTISISNGGFLDETYQGNTINTQGSSTATDMVLTGNHFGTKILDNTLIGGGNALVLDAYPTGSPNIWGWSHVPSFGVVIQGNTLQDSLNGGQIDVTHSSYTKTDVGRTYLSATLSNNTVVWTDAFLSKNNQSGLSAFTVGDSLSKDPAEILLNVQGNGVQISPNIASTASIRVISGTVNGTAMTSQSISLPTPTPPMPTKLHLVDDDGISASDGITSDALLSFDPAANMPGYEYSLSGLEGTYQAVTSASGFVPDGLQPGFNTVFVRAVDATGNRGPAEAIAFVYDTTPAAAVPGVVPPNAGRKIYAYRLGTGGNFVPLGTAVAVDPSLLANGTPLLQVQTIAGAGGPGTGQESTSPGTHGGAGGIGDGPRATPGAADRGSAATVPGAPIVPANGPRRLDVGPNAVKVIGHAWQRTGHTSRAMASPRPRVHLLDAWRAARWRLLARRAAHLHPRSR